MDGVPTILGGFEEGLPEGATGVVDEDRRCSETGGRLLEGPFDLVCLAHVDREAESAHLGADVGCIGVAFPDGDAGAEGGKHLGHTAAYAGAAAGDDGHPAVESDGVGAWWGRIGECHVMTLRSAGCSLRVRWRRR